MALTLDIATQESLGLQEYADLITQTVDCDDFDSFVASATLLKKLANNNNLVLDHVHDKLLTWEHAQRHGLGDTSFVLARQGRLCVRANIWLPPSEMPISQKLYANVLAYLTPHDHHFSFITVGYFGCGYETTIYEYDREVVAGRIGEKVSLRFLERTSLPRGKVMVYRGCKDVHRQDHPREFSLSLNLMLFPFEYQDQYTFDITTSSISGRVGDFRRMQRLMCKVAAVLGDARTTNVLEQVAARNTDEEIRLSAFEAWTRLNPVDALEIWTRALRDPHQSVRDRAWREMAAVDRPNDEDRSGTLTL